MTVAAYLFNALTSFFPLIFGLAANILAIVTGTFLALAVSLLKLVLSPHFISLPYTGLENPLIAVGWTLTRDLTNIFFVVAMIVIGLGTALRWQAYDYKKTLPILIAIALLINFTPVILGLIVDASNTLMNFFVQGSFNGGDFFINASVSQFGNINALLNGARFWDPKALAEGRAAAAGSFALIFFNLFAALIYLLFSVVIFVRYIAIWLLVVLSPLAFACYIFQATKQFWSEWWKMFIQWCFIGPILAFFLYLGDNLIRALVNPDATNSLVFGSMEAVNDAPGLSSIINALLPPFAVLIFLFAGLIFSLRFAPAGADTIMKAGQRGITKSREISQRWAGQAIKTGAGVAVAPITRGIQEYRAARYPAMGGPLSRRQALGVAVRRTAGDLKGTYKRATQAAIPTRAAVRTGLWQAAKDVWKTTMHEKLKTKKCPGDPPGVICGKTIDGSSNVCPHCGHVF